MIKAVIFDMDGTMVDTEALHFGAYHKVINSFGKKITEDDYWRLWDRDKDMCKSFVAELHLEITSEKLLEMKNKTYRESLSQGFNPQKGLLELLKMLKRDGYVLAVASSAQIEEIKMIITSLGIEHYFRVLAPAESVENGKPAPDIYLFTAKKLGVLPEECLVIEDAPKGVLAAKSAGMKCFAIPSRQVKDKDFSKADIILGSLDEVYPLINKI